ncbi:efflux transporter outer membrane subunit [Chromobacterium haemolyticum]|uniref:efflux transporter outer membrane subunit n=1 Tax=Chromobacterium haemolyticum TaxID=394935 RepID=UPI0040574F44
MMRPIALLLLLLLALGGCAGMEPSRPAPALPERYSQALPGHAPDAQAWDGFGDPGLSRWIATVREGNIDLAASLARLDAARAELGVLNADRYPKLDFEQSVERRKLSKFDLGEVGEDTANPSTRYSTRLALGYEVDLRGRVSAAVRAGRADLKASGGDLDALGLSLARQTTELWLTRAELAADIELLREAARLRQRLLAGVAAKRRVGLASGRQLLEPDSEASEAARLLAQQGDALKRVERSLCQLAAQMPNACGLPPARPLRELRLPEVGGEVPARLLQRRPDLSAAQARYDAARARIDEAEAARWPSLTLNGGLGISAGSWSALRGSKVLNWSLLPQLDIPLFDAGKRKAEAQRAHFAAAEQYAAWRGAVTRAVYEVEDAAAAAHFAGTDQEAKQRQYVDASRRLRAERDARGVGLSDGQAEWRAQLAQLQAEQGVQGARRQQLLAAANLIAALGGGWEGADKTTP